MVLKHFWKVLFCAAVAALLLVGPSANVFVAQAQDGTPPSRQQSTTNPTQRDFDAAETPAELLTKAQTLGRVRVIVGFNTRTGFQPEGTLSTAQAQVQQTAITQARQSLLQTIVTNNATLLAQSDQWMIPYVALQVDAAGLQALQASPQVASIREDGLNFQLNNTASLNNMNVPNAWAEGYAGSGFAVAILDNGIQAGHSFLGGRVIAEYCNSTYDNQYYAPAYVLKSLCPGGIYTQEQVGLGASNPTACMDLAAGYGTNSIPGEYCDHGTHVAGIAAGNDGDNGTTNDGVARGANIIGVQVFTYIQCSAVGIYCSGDGIGAFDSNIIAGLQYVYSLRNSYPIAAVNMSLGGGKYSSQAACDSAEAPTKAIIDQLRAVNIATIIASGNNFYGDGISSPGCISSAVAVGSTSDNGEYPDYMAGKISSFTNTSFMLDLLASGYGINSSVTYPVNSFANKSGTSMASPQVAGAWAVVRTALPNASVTQILQAFQQTGTPVWDDVRADGYQCGDGFDPCSYFEFPLINVGAAITSLLPTMPALVAPVQDGSTFSKPLLTWTADQANSYEVRLDVVYPPAAQVTVNAASYTPTTALKGKLYYWQVRAHNNMGGVSGWSEIRSFYNIDAPTDRNYFNSNTAQFSWSRITWATGYEVQIGTNSTFIEAGDPVPLSASTFTYETLPLSDGLYYWRVRAMNGTSEGGWSSPEPFVIDFIS
jgi:subtilisin